jgi:hypothetical protein
LNRSRIHVFLRVCAGGGHPCIWAWLSLDGATGACSCIQGRVLRKDGRLLQPR